MHSTLPSLELALQSPIYPPCPTRNTIYEMLFVCLFFFFFLCSGRHMTLSYLSKDDTCHTCRTLKIATHLRSISTLRITFHPSFLLTSSAFRKNPSPHPETHAPKHYLRVTSPSKTANEYCNIQVWCAYLVEHLTATHSFPLVAHHVLCLSVLYRAGLFSGPWASPHRPRCFLQELETNLPSLPSCQAPHTLG